MDLDNRTLLRSIALTILLLALLGFAGPASAQPDPEPTPADEPEPPRPVCKPPKDCNDCSQKKVRDSLSEALMKRLGETIADKLETDDLPKKAADKISGGIGDILEKIVNEGGSPEDQQAFDANRDPLENFPVSVVHGFIPLKLRRCRKLRH
jgi:hypothetical protein